MRCGGEVVEDIAIRELLRRDVSCILYRAIGDGDST